MFPNRDDWNDWDSRVELRCPDNGGNRAGLPAWQAFRRVDGRSFSSRPTKTELVVLIMLCMMSTGCRLWDNAWRTSVSEPLQYSNYWQDKWARVRFRNMAHDALEQERALARAERDDYHNEPFTPEHELGFVDGFVDFLFAGGTGDPPPLPPRKFWKAEFQNPHGYRAAIDWFHGYKHGAVSARTSGIRNFVTVPVAGAVASTTTPYPYEPTLRFEPRNAVETIGPASQTTSSPAASASLPSLTRLPPAPGEP